LLNNSDHKRRFTSQVVATFHGTESRPCLADCQRRAASFHGELTESPIVWLELSCGRVNDEDEETNLVLLCQTSRKRSRHLIGPYGPILVGYNKLGKYFGKAPSLPASPALYEDFIHVLYKPIQGIDPTAIMEYANNILVENNCVFEARE
jgi:hypothetical protein